MVKKNFEDMYNHLDSKPACDRRTEGQTDGRTDILRRHSPRYAYASSSKTGGQSNLTKSASRGPIPRLGVTPGGRNLYH